MSTSARTANAASSTALGNRRTYSRMRYFQMNAQASCGCDWSERLRTVCYALSTVLLICGTSGLAVRASESEVEPPRQSEVRLLRMPFPYEAAATVCSDTHSASVEVFEAVHKLVNSRSRIEHGSETWKLLFDDPEIERRDQWRDGIDGFGLPIADSCFLYSPANGIFASFDAENGAPVPHSYKGEDYRDIIDRWIRSGWVDTLHTSGSGDIPREATRQGLQWLQQDPRRRLKVWTNHSITGTPTCIEPDNASLTMPVLKNLVKLGTAFLWHCGARDFVATFASNPFPNAFPRSQRVLCWVLSLTLIFAMLAMPVCLVVRRLRRLRYFVIAISAGVVVLGILYATPAKYGQGDNPGTPYYCADLVREAGFRYYWTLDPNDGRSGLVTANKLALPERDWDGRSSMLHLVEMDDGSSCLVFSRTYKGDYGKKSLESLTEGSLEELCETGGISILYTHWVSPPQEVFTAKGLTGLRALQRQYDQKRIWVSRLSDILDFEFARTFLEYEVREEDGKQIIDIQKVNPPVGEPFVPNLEDLSGISFECPADQPVEVVLGGEPVDRDSLVYHQSADSLIVQFPLRIAAAVINAETGAARGDAPETRDSEVEMTP